ncbi:MAG: DNA helicase II [Gammaproteobacteria bacterium]
MMITNLLATLNEKQQQAVSAPPNHQLILAGAGSGKTRVLIHRISWLIASGEASPYSILAVTFTNKAANEMRARMSETLQTSVAQMWIGTFHGLAHRLLRMHWQDAGLPEGFQILDSDDQLRYVKRVIKYLELDDTRWKPKQAQSFINAKKDAGLRPEHIEPGFDLFVKTQLRIYQEYENIVRQAGVVDFAEILLRTYELLRDNPVLLTHYQQRFKYILVDEFQDTNAIQYAWLKQLVGNENYLTIVGDDDQSIYGWRGAKIENIHRFTKDFPNAQVTRLEQNYRSTQTILSASNALISNNTGRLGKELWTQDAEGEDIAVYEAFNEIDEAHFITAEIKKWGQLNSYSDVAILYRSNAQSRVLEESLIQANIPYRIYGGQRFFERAEIKDALAYLRLVTNGHDGAAFERVINWPTRGIGDATQNLIREQSRSAQQSLWDAAEAVIAQNILSARAAKSLQLFLNLIAQLRETVWNCDNLYEQVEAVIKGSGLIEQYRATDRDKMLSRLENLEELITAARTYQPEHDEGSKLNSFLAHAALEAGEEQADEHQACVQLMTLHSAKGLEFPLVFMCGLEEGLFPHQMAIAEHKHVEEERRLCYVGMTRAMKKLVLSYAQIRRFHGREAMSPPSRFIKEIPEEFLSPVRVTKAKSASGGYRTVSNYQVPNPIQAALPFQLGARVRHEKFSDGTILAYEGQGEHARVQVNFDKYGSKWLVLAYAKLVEIKQSCFL